jgi:hypothetical protein
MKSVFNTDMTISEVTETLESADFLYEICCKFARNGSKDFGENARFHKNRKRGIIDKWSDNINPYCK